MSEQEEFEFRLRLEQEGSKPAAAPAKPAKSDDFQRGRNEAGGMARGAMSVLQGPTMGFGDEILGAIGGAYDTAVKGGSFSDNYRQNRDYVRGAQSVEQENNPVVSTVTQMAASAPLGLVRFGAAAVAKPLNMLERAMQAGKVGAAYGAASGAGNSTAETVSGVALDAVKGGATGAALNAGAVPVLGAVGAVGGNVLQRVSDSAAADYARQKVAQAITRDGRGAVVQSGQSNPVTQAGARLDKLGPRAVIADAGGENTRQLLDTVVTLPGQSKPAAAQLLRERKLGQADELIGAAERGLGTQGQRLAPTVDGIIQQRQQDAAPLYEQLYARNVQPTPGLQGILQAADELGATKIARDLATARQLPYTLDVLNPQAGGMGAVGRQPGTWSMRDLDHVKQGLDDLISKQWDAVNGKYTSKGQALMGLKDRLTGELDRLTTDSSSGRSLYAAARNAFAGPSALIDAGKAGQRAFNQNEAQLTQSLGSMSSSELEAFRIGAYEALRDKLGRSAGGRTEMMAYSENPVLREKLRVIFGSERGFREFASALERERTLKGLQSVGAGSQTAARQYAAGDLDVAPLTDAGNALTNAASGNVPGMVSSAGNVWNRVKTPEPVRNQIGRILMTGGPQGQRELNALQRLAERINEQQAQLSRESAVLLSRPAGTFFLDR